MKRIWLCVGVVLIFFRFALADQNLRIEDIGLHGYLSDPAPVTLLLHNPSSQPASIELRITISALNNPTRLITARVSLSGGEQRRLELPIPTNPAMKVTANAFAGGSLIGHDSADPAARGRTLIALLCDRAESCKAIQSQIQFSGSDTDTAEKNRQLAFEVINDPRDDWWAYRAAKAIVVARPLAQLTSPQRNALEGYLRCGGRIVLLQDEVADDTFLSAYRKSPQSPEGEHVGRGLLFLVSGLQNPVLGDIFAGRSFQFLFAEPNDWWNGPEFWLRRRFAQSFAFPRLRWMILWLVAYILIVGVLNFAILRRLKRLEYGWISICGLAILFAAVLYFSSARDRPKDFRLDNIVAYYLDSASPTAAADYYLRISAPVRRVVLVSIAGNAILVPVLTHSRAPNSQIWTEMNGEAHAEPSEDVDLGPPRQVDLAMLKWSYRDLNLRGLHPFSGTVHFVAPNRLRNDTGQRFDEAIYLDFPTRKVYALPPLSPGAEVQLDSITPTRIGADEDDRRLRRLQDRDIEPSLEDLVLSGQLGLTNPQRMFVGLSDGPALPVELSVPHQERAHALVIVSMEQP
jgi:hypothetical protein